MDKYIIFVIIIIINKYIRFKIKIYIYVFIENDYILKSRNNNVNYNSVFEKNFDCYKNIM